MCRRFSILFLLLLLPCSFGLSSAAPGRVPPNPIPREQVTARRLENGLTVIVRSYPSAPLAAVDLWVRAGSVDDGGAGAAHALEHMVFRGGQDVPAGRVDAAVEAVGGVVYATTYPDATRYWAVVAPEHLITAMAALADAMHPPTVAPDLWERERRVMLEEIARDRGDIAAETRRALAGRLFGSVYGVPVMGTPAALGRLEPEDIRAFHRRAYRPDRMVAVVVGKVDPEKVFRHAEDTLGRISKQEQAATEQPGTERAQPRAMHSIVEVEADNGGTVAVGYAWPAPSGDAAVVDVLAAVLRRRLDAALNGRARRVEVSHPWQRADMLIILAEGAERDREALRAGIRRALSAPVESISAAEVASAARQRQWSWWLDHEKPASQSRSLGLAATLGSVRDATEAPARLGKVTLEDVRAAAAKIRSSW